MCKTIPLLSVLISSYCLCLIAVDRYRSIVTPLKVPWSVREAQWLMVGNEASESIGFNFADSLLGPLRGRFLALVHCAGVESDRFQKCHILW